VQFLNLARIPADLPPRFEAVVVLNWANGPRLRSQLGIRAPLVLWLSHAVDRPVVASLAEPDVRDGWNGFAFVSDWQQERYIEQFRIPREKARVLRNAISPAFAETPLAPAWLFNCQRRRQPASRAFGRLRKYLLSRSFGVYPANQVSGPGPLSNAKTLRRDAAEFHRRR
jgi:hypothetical protein